MASRKPCQTRVWDSDELKPSCLNYMRLILIYRKESLRDETTIYPASSRPAVPITFRTTLNALMLTPFELPFTPTLMLFSP